MRRLLFILLMLAMPLQSVWAAAASYCTHEAAPTTAHFGHHAHQHGADADKSNSGTNQSPSSLDMDCHTCHSQTNALRQTSNATALWTPELQRAPALRFVLPTPSPQRPERPNWRPLA